jgi:hypothetical protein
MNVVVVAALIIFVSVILSNAVNLVVITSFVTLFVTVVIVAVNNVLIGRKQNTKLQDTY